MSELIEQTKKIDQRCHETSRDMRNLQAVFSQQFAQAQQREYGAAQEISHGTERQNELVSHVQSMRNESQITKGELGEIR